MDKRLKHINFLGNELDRKLYDYKKAKVAVIPCPYEKTVTYGRGCSYGPSSILEASSYLELFDDELLRNTYKIGVHTLPPLNVMNLSPDKMTEHVRKKVSTIINTSKFPVIIGGEHSVSIGSVLAVSKKFKDLTVIHFDAHSDLRDSYMGSKFNHACVARRFYETSDVVQVGVRSFSEEEYLFAKKNNIRIFGPDSIIKKHNAARLIKEVKNKNVYLSIDMDVFDPSIMPGVGTPEPNGLNWRTITGLVKNISSLSRVRGMDIVELVPVKNINFPSFLTAKLIYRILGYLF